jgi:hypothetical protein
MKILFKKLEVSSKKSERIFVIYLILPVIFSFSYGNSQVISDKDVEICKSKFQFAVDKDLKEKPIGDVIAEIGKSFIGTDYLAHSLEKDGDENLVINLTGLDCTTFLENSLVLARCIKQDDTSFQNYINELQYIRYRWGIILYYTSRLHYFSDWIHDNMFKSVVRDMTKEIGGEEIKFELSYMTSHPENYKPLTDNPSFIKVMKGIEKEISCREYFVIPKQELSSKEKYIQNGDLLGITTTVEGLDIGHTGIAVKMDDGRIHLLHAPSENTKVQISKEPLSDYLMKYKRHSGVIVLRALEQVK